MEHHGPPLKPLPDHNPPYKRVEELRHETASVPSSPKTNAGRYSPRKTHVSNFINQYGNLNELNRRRSSPEPMPRSAATETPHIQLNGMQMKPPKSPKPRRRYRSQSPRVCIDVSESDSDHESKNVATAAMRRKALHDHGHGRGEINGNVEMMTKKLQAKERVTAADRMNHNVAKHTTNMVSFNRMAGMAGSYCPQSEPLKRKIYSEKTLDRLQKSLEMESGKYYINTYAITIQLIRFHAILL